MNKGGSIAVTCGVFSALLTTAALAVSVALAPGGTVTVPATTVATEPDLAGPILHDAGVPFVIHTVTGAVLCQGQVQDRAVRSTRTGAIHFYQAIRYTSGTGFIGRVARRSFGTLPLRVGYRTDSGVGTIVPTLGARTAAGPVVTFSFLKPALSCARHQESRFILVKTTFKTFAPGGLTQLVATTGQSTVVKTIQP